MIGCSHPENETIIDQHEGFVICQLCSRVIAPVFVDEFNSFHVTTNHFPSNLIDLACNNNINNDIIIEAQKVLTKLRLELPKRLTMHLELFSLFYAGLKFNTPYLISEISSMFGLQTKQGIKILSSISKATNYKYLIGSIPNPLLYFNRLIGDLLTAREKQSIFKIYKALPQKFNLRTTELLIAGIAYNFKKHQFQSRASKGSFLKAISNNMHVNIRSVRLIDRQIDQALKLKDSKI